LRDLLTEALEVIEIDFRARLAYNFGSQYGAFGYLAPDHFFTNFDHGEFLAQLRKETERSSELFVEHFRHNYAQYPDLPIWMLTEIASFGVLVRMFRGAHRHDQKPLAAEYGLQAKFFATVLLHLVYVRNLCAHHARIWDRLWAMKATLPQGSAWRPPLVLDNTRVYSTVCLIQFLLNRRGGIGNFASEWKNRLHDLLQKLPTTPHAPQCMGLPQNWQTHPVWK
jgi:abortive infection bacteriophage resistance protein